MQHTLTVCSSECLFFTGLPFVSLCLDILSYDIILSFSQETKYIWESKWSAVKVLYFLVRYYAVINLIPIIAIWTRTSPGLSIAVYVIHSFMVLSDAHLSSLQMQELLLLDHYCRSIHIYRGSGRHFDAACLGTIQSQQDIIRDTLHSGACRFWGESIYSLVSSLVASSGILSTDFAIKGTLFAVVRYTKGLAANVVQAPTPFRGCSSTDPISKTIILAYVPNFALSVLFLAMTLWKLFQNQKMLGDVSWTNLRDLKGMSPLLIAFVRDGSIFFAQACLAGFLGLVSTYVVHGVIASVFYPWTLVIYSFSGAHLVLDLRAAGKEGTSQSWDATMSTHRAQGRGTRGMTFA
ncbi:hypothetical protein M413DRAFT_31896 [Hebeloma cylindrosporum]|uniref:DUF6533 domain-containing protein n=1 Tax=Hebeloma cylindrosporum TaxID=76867 RepID=A0A0C2Y528_HEBCY|nr:hypothetical protein M413DRAFT_31896 [Hebeloma cylindrosporum h7]